MDRRVVVIGGGIAGLAAAHALSSICPAGTSVTVIDGARQLGGKLRTSSVAGLPVDEGAESFLVRVPDAVDLVESVGLGAELVHPATTEASVAVDGVLRRLPGGTVFGVPGDLDELAESGVLSSAGLARVRAEAEARGDGVVDDIAVGPLVRDRLGPEVLDRLVDPLLGGVYAGRADNLSLAATMPAIAAALRRPGSLVAAARAARATGAGNEGPVFAALRGGFGSLVTGLMARLDAQIRLALPVRVIDRAEGGFLLTAGPVPHPTRLAADAVVLAVPAAPAARLLRTVAPAAATDLAAIDYASVAIVTLAYPPAPLPRGSGVLVANGTGRAVKAVTYSSQKWAHLAGDAVIVRASIGRHGEETVLQRDDDELVALAAADIAAVTGLGGNPIDSRVTRWGGALPQYAVGHLDRVRRIRESVAAVPGLAVAGAAYDGVGIPACIRSGTLAAQRVAAHLRESVHG